MKHISPCLWFDNQAEEAARYYVSVFKNGKLGDITRYVEDAHGTVGQVLTVEFEIDGIEFTALNGGPMFKFSEAVSFQIPCKDQEEVDRYWDELTSNGGEESMCGWLKDRFGVSWQVVPVKFQELMTSGETAKVKRMTEAMYQMRKLDLAKLEAAYNG